MDRSSRLGFRFCKSGAKRFAEFAVILRKFSIIRKRIIGFETPTPSLHTSMTGGIEFSKLRKPNQRFAFLKFTYFVPHNRVCANNTDISCSSKFRFFLRLLKCRKNRYVSRAKRFARSLSAKLNKKFLVLFSKRTYFLIKLTFQTPLQIKI